MSQTYGATAKRVAKGSKLVVIVTLPNGQEVTVGGARAARATFALISEAGPAKEATEFGAWPAVPWHVHGLRSSGNAAASEAARLNFTPYRTFQRCVAIPVEG